MTFEPICNGEFYLCLTTQVVRNKGNTRPKRIRIIIVVKTANNSDYLFFNSEQQAISFRTLNNIDSNLVPLPIPNKGFVLCKKEKIEN